MIIKTIFQKHYLEKFFKKIFKNKIPRIQGDF